MKINESKVKQGYKVFTGNVNDRTKWSLEYPYRAYDENRWTVRRNRFTKGPFCVFDDLEKATAYLKGLKFFHHDLYYTRSIEGFPKLVLCECSYIKSKCEHIWLGWYWTTQYKSHISELTEGTVLADAVKIGKWIKSKN